MISARHHDDGLPGPFWFLESYAGAVTSFLILLSVLAATGLAVSLRRTGVRLFLELEETVLFLGGGAMIVACFFLAHNIHYRAILLLLTVPLLLAWTRNDSSAVRFAGWIGVGLVAFAVFQNFLRMNILNVAGAVVIGSEGRTRIAFWALEEVVWWTLVTGLMSAMLLIAWDSPVGIWARRIARSRTVSFLVKKANPTEMA